MIEILHKDKDFLVCVKPQGVSSQSDLSGEMDMTALLKNYLEEANENSDIFVVHRLDRATGGIVLYARNKVAAAVFSSLVAQKDGFEKQYLTVVSGMPESESGSMSDFLFKDSAQKKSFVVKSERKGAKVASLDYETVKTLKQGEKVFSLLQIKLNTGRFHQIRSQLASRGMPVYGDGKYGSREKAPHFALWANKIIFTYKGKKYQFEKDPDFDTMPWNLFN